MLPSADVSAWEAPRQMIYVNVVKDAESTWEFDTHRTVELNRANAGDTFVDLPKPAKGSRDLLCGEAD